MAHDILELLTARRNALAETAASTYVNQQEINSIWQMEEEIRRGRDAEKDAAAYFEFTQNNKWSWQGFSKFRTEQTQ